MGFEPTVEIVAFMARNKVAYSVAVMRASHWAKRAQLVNRLQRLIHDANQVEQPAYGLEWQKSIKNTRLGANADKSPPRFLEIRVSIRFCDRPVSP